MPDITASLSTSKRYTELGIEIPSGDTESVTFSATVQSVSINSDQINIRYSVEIDGVRGDSLLSLTSSYDPSSDLIAQAEKAIKSLYTAESGG